MKRILLMFLTNWYKLPYLFFKLLSLSNAEKYDRFTRYAFLHKFVVGANRGGRVEIQTTGLENLPKEQGYVMFPNHQGLYDVLSILEYHPTPFSVVMKIENKDVFLLRKVGECFGAEFMDRDDIRQSLTVINKMAARIREGENFVIFPEGTRSKQGNNLIAFKPGAFKSATLAKAPIVPVALIDSFIPFDVPSIKKTTVYLHFMEPIPYEEYKDMKTPEIALLVHDRIQNYIQAKLQKI